MARNEAGLGMFEPPTEASRTDRPSLPALPLAALASKSFHGPRPTSIVVYNTAMEHVLHAFDLLKEEKPEIAGVCALVGDDRFLKRLARTKIRDAVLDDGDATEYDAKTMWRDVIDDISTLSLFGDGPRLVFISGGDEFVKNNRTQLETYSANPSSSGILVIDMNTLASNTRLYKTLAESGQIVECRPPQKKRGKGSFLDESRLCEWLREWGKSTHQVNLKRGADEELLQLVGPELGLLDQELAKLALFCDAKAEVTVELVQQVVGGWRTKTTWELLDAALDGNAAEAISQLERLLQAGEAPQAIAGAMLWSLRRFADTAQLVMEAEHSGRKISLPMALEQAGFKKWPKGALARAEKQLRQLGRERAGDLYGKLLQLDLSMKGSHSSPTRARWALEQFLVSLSKQASVA